MEISSMDIFIFDIDLFNFIFKFKIKMKLGIAYNIFDDALELLEPSIRSVRNHADYITIVYQTISNFGNHATLDILAELERLKELKLIDNYIQYNPILSQGGHYNELMKRNIGLFDCKRNDCSHFMSMDSDELYLDKEMAYIKEEIEKNDYDASACQMLTYYKNGEYILDPPEEYYVSMIYKITNFAFQLNSSFPVLVDPTRRIPCENIRIFKRNEIQMHHFSGVRKDYRKKLENSSAKVNFAYQINDLVDYYEKWKYPMQALMPGAPPKYYNIKKVENLFGI